MQRVIKILILALFISTAYATNLQPYLGGSYGLARLSLSQQVNNTTQGGTINLNNGYSLFGGVMFARYWGVELAYVNYGSYTDSFANTNFKTSFTSLGLNLKGQYQFTDSPFLVYAKGGVNQVNIMTSSDIPLSLGPSHKFGLGAAVGAGYVLVQNLTANLGLDLVNFTATSNPGNQNISYTLMLYSIGLQYLF